MGLRVSHRENDKNRAQNMSDLPPGCSMGDIDPELHCPFCRSKNVVVKKLDPIEIETDESDMLEQFKCRNCGEEFEG